MTADACGNRRPLRIELFWGPEVLAGAALTVVDVLRTINALAAMRTPRAPEPVKWRWRPMTAMGRVPALLPRSTGFRGVADVCVVPGWHAHSGPHLDRLVQEARGTASRLAQVHAGGGLIAGLANGVALLGEAGLLTGRQAVAPWPFVAPVLRHSDGVELVSDRAWMMHERLWTCDSPVLATEVILDLLRHTVLAELAAATAPLYMHSAERQQVAARIVKGAHQHILPTGALERARRWLESHLAEPYSLEATAQAASTSSRTLLRHFAATYGQSPLDHLHALRVARARVLLETTYLPVEQVAQACGYQDVGTFRRIFLRATGKRPADYRDQHRLRTSRKRWSGKSQA
ncbi:MAG: helix-turn-helix domain-containing protein [Burkholderiaceae bacterium]|nr:helix-turn-helix domain-containing protein [Burkholderiaceae bacterium]